MIALKGTTREETSAPGLEQTTRQVWHEAVAEIADKAKAKLVSPIKPLSAARILCMLQWLLGCAHPESWAWGEAYMRNAVGRLERWLSEPENPQPQLQTVLFTKVVLALMSGRSAGSFLDTQRAKHMAVMRELTRQRREATAAHDALLADYQLFHIEADLRWIDHAAGRLSTLADEVR